MSNFKKVLKVILIFIVCCIIGYFFYVFSQLNNVAEV